MLSVDTNSITKGEDKMSDFSKWDTIFKLVGDLEGCSIMIYKECDWICTEFSTTLSGETMFIIAPLQTHPYGKEFGVYPSQLSSYVVSEIQLEKQFAIQNGRSYIEEQKKRRVDY